MIWQSFAISTHLIHLFLMIALLIILPIHIDYRERLKGLLLGYLISHGILGVTLALNKLLSLELLPEGPFPGSISQTVYTWELLSFLTFTLVIDEFRYRHEKRPPLCETISPTRFEQSPIRWFIFPIGLVIIGIFHWLDPFASHMPARLELDDALLRDVQGHPHRFLKKLPANTQHNKRLWMLWHSECSACIEQLRDISRHHQSNPEKWTKFDLILVNEGDELLPMLRAMPRDLVDVATILWDKPSYLATQLGIRRIPITLLTDHEHRILQHQIGEWFMQ